MLGNFGVTVHQNYSLGLMSGHCACSILKSSNCCPPWAMIHLMGSAISWKLKYVTLYTGMML